MRQFIVGAALACSVIAGSAACFVDAPSRSHSQSAALDDPTASAAALTRWGMVMGGDLFHSKPDDAAIVDDLVSLGVHAIRVEALLGSEGDYPTSFAPLVNRAKAKGMTVLIVRQPRDYLRCTAADEPPTYQRVCSEAEWLNDYADGLTKTVHAFRNADAFELGNETNGERPFSPEVFVKLLLRGYAVVKALAPSARVVSGGLLNSNPDSDYWHAFIAALPKGAAPWDVFGIHPYNPLEFRSGTWVTDTRRQLVALHADLAAKVGPQTFWATEVGFATTTGPRGIDNIAGDEARQAATFAPTDEGLAGNVALAFWYDYVNDAPGSRQGFDFGVRQWGDTPKASTAKALYGVMRSRLTGRAGMSAAAPTSPADPPPPATPVGAGTQPGGPVPASMAPSCGVLVSMRGWLGNPLCDTGSGVCEGQGEASSDCQRCCVSTQIHCGSLQRVNGWGTSAACDNGASGICGGSYPTMDCAGGCCTQ